MRRGIYYLGKHMTEETNNLTLSQVKDNPKNNNPTGAGGFGDHPENINREGTIKTPLYWIRHHGQKSSEEVHEALKRPAKEMTMFEEIGLRSLAGARGNLQERKDVINRVDGMPKQSVELGGDADNPVIVDIKTTLERIYGAPREMPVNSKE